MTTAENSRADAPTDEQIASAWFATSDARNLRPHERAVEVVRKFLAASPVEKPAPSLIDEDAEVPPIMYNGDTKRDPALRELLARQATRHVLTNSRGDSKQPAAAPIDIGVDYLEKLRALMVRLGLATNESLEGFGAALEDNLYRTIRAVEALVDATVTPAPSPADERAAFDSEVGNIIADAATRGIAWMAFKVGARYARAASANDTGAEAVAIPQSVINALRFYANGHHFNIDEDHQQFDTVSGEPQNWLCSERDDDCTMIEDGSIAKAALCGGVLGFEESEKPIEGEVFTAAQQPAQADARVGLTGEQWEELRLIARTYNERGFPKHAREFFARVHPARPEPRAEVTHGDTTMDECMASLLDRLEAAELYADRYRYLRERPLNAVSVGGVFAGKTPDNVVLNGADLDAAIDAARTGASS
ncbi:gp38 [Burkholderia pseudomallei]|uniref:hypothetical protein n=1 Tax=Burkholderia pseudomallei TaxID=28450 RepID=UPI0005E58AFD|nr:hypothetical protein [Burkholderia pseudomallei]CAJ9928245.1 gp38 [Burkholderia pseudomallei]CAK1307328.1 gp38 [Burkholderia pseudomallei]CPG55316.1 gp38 [Burkholderia pseudomallei]